ncbi:MAG: RNA-binding protein [Bacteroidaceae bacterium]|nr:RNA-binding protein [Bacteroidaceae bacterium]
MGAAGNKQPKKPKNKNHVPSYLAEEAVNEASKKPKGKKK